MTITVCDICKTQGDEARICRWIEIRFSYGTLARFFDKTNNRKELCEDCFNKLVENLK